MNVLEQAAELIENGWCTQELMDGDGKYCSVGAVLAASGVKIDANEASGYAEGRYVYNLYDYARSIPAIKALAEEIGERGNFMSSNPVSTIYYWNDDQNDVNEVLEVFKHAAKRLD